MKTIKSAFQFLSGRWVQMALGLILICFSGGASIFSSYSQNLKEELAYSQMAVNSLSSSKELGTFMGNVVYFTLKFLPTWLNIFLGAVGNWWGYFNFWVSVYQRPPTWNLNLLIFLGAASQQLIISASSSTLRNFPQSKHTARTIVKGFEIIGGSVLIHTYTSIFGEDKDMLIPYMAFLPTALCLISFIFFQKMNPKTHEVGEDSIMSTTLCRASYLACGLLFLTICRMNMVSVFPRVGLIADGVCVCALLAFAIKGVGEAQVKSISKIIK